VSSEATNSEQTNSKQLYAELLDLAVATARAAGDLARDGRESAMDVQTKSSAVDVVTAMDKAAEALIAARLLGARPQDGILGEEGADVVGSSGVRWVVDPIDGTVNYLYRIPAWSVSIAAELDGRAVAGAVYVPLLGEMYSATLGGGATLAGGPTGDGVPLRVNSDARLGHALVGTGFGYDSGRRARQGALVAQLLPQVRDIRRFGSCAVDLCALAAGRLDAYFERGLQPWDMAAGVLIAREAGARVEGLHGAPSSPELLIAANPALFPALHDALAPLDPTSG
jgi:myo-inositol-1(or 4)-monophosphatase